MQTGSYSRPLYARRYQDYVTIPFRGRFRHFPPVFMRKKNCKIRLPRYYATLYEKTPFSFMTLHSLVLPPSFSHSPRIQTSKLSPKLLSLPFSTLTHIYPEHTLNSFIINNICKPLLCVDKNR